MYAGYLSPHFRVREVFEEHQPTDTQLWLAKILARDLLEPVRKIVDCALYISDGYRSWARWKDLKRRGYKPYRHSDHSYLEAWNPFGVGAVDLLLLVRTRTNHIRREPFRQEHYETIVEAMAGEGNPPWGQLIWYPDRGHIHVSNRREVYFSEAFIAAHGFPAREATYTKEEASNA